LCQRRSAEGSGLDVLFFLAWATVASTVVALLLVFLVVFIIVDHSSTSTTTATFTVQPARVSCIARLAIAIDARKQTGTRRLISLHGRRRCAGDQASQTKGIAVESLVSGVIGLLHTTEAMVEFPTGATERLFSPRTFTARGEEPARAATVGAVPLAIEDVGVLVGIIVGTELGRGVRRGIC
jgi:hypothetical protein